MSARSLWVLLACCSLVTEELWGQAREGRPQNSSETSWGKGWQCNGGYIERAGNCISLGAATDDEIRRYLIAESIAAYSGSCPCPYNSDRAGRRCGGRSAYSRRGGYAPLCYPADISEDQVRKVRAQYRKPG